MKYLSVFSGIEAASVAWHPLGWIPVGFSEIEPFPCKLLAHRFPHIPNHGDVNRHPDWNIPQFDLLVGGSPCQAFSIAGMRAGLADPRGNLTLVFLGLVAARRPSWVVWENVPGVLSDKTNAFGCLLQGMGELGYSCAWRVLDAKYFGVPQRRRRVFLVGHLGDWRRPAAVLFEPEGVRRNPSESGEARQGAARGASGRTWPASTSCTLTAAFATKWGLEDQHVNEGCPLYVSDVAPTLSARTRGGGGLGTDFDCDGGLVAYNNSGQGYWLPAEEAAAAVRAGNKCGGGGARESTVVLRRAVRRITPLEAERLQGFPDGGGQVAVAYDLRGRDGGSQLEGPHDTVNLRAASGGSSRSYVAARAVRRITPLEAERLQGFPDGWTDIPGAGDGPRYRALGNSMAVPVMRWIGRRIQKVVSAC